MMMAAAAAMAFGARAAYESDDADIYEETVDGYTWSYQIDCDEAVIYRSELRSDVDEGGSYEYYQVVCVISPWPKGAVTIPSKLGGKPVTRIGRLAFSSCGGLTSVTIPDSVTSIGDSAFRGCRGLTSVTIPGSVTNIGDRVFSFCSGLLSISVDSGNANYRSVNGLLLSNDSKTLIQGVNGNVTIPDSVTSIGSSAFYHCSGLTSVTIPNSVTSIGSSAFSGCSGLTSVTIPHSVTSIGNSAFINCSGLTSVTIPDSLTSIKYHTFYGCSGLTSVTISDSVTSIGSFAFYNCTNLTSMTIPNSVTSIGSSAFLGCSGLTSVKIPDSVTHIGDSAFESCEGLTSVTIPDSVTSIGSYAFSDCPAYWNQLYRTIFAPVASPSVVTTIVQQVAAPYALTNAVSDRAIASVTVNADCAIDSFVLKDGKVYDTMLRIVNTADHDVKLTLPAGNVYETFKGVKPLMIPANSRSMLSITRTADKTFLVSREELETVE